MASVDTQLLHSPTVLGKRKATDRHNLVLHLASSPEPSANTDSEVDSPPRRHASISRSQLQSSAGPSRVKQRGYHCTYEGCDKSYTKPSRLEEHQRTHNGERPFICSTCTKSYLRESHLQAHQRSHLPESAKPLACPEVDCDKRFWTAQHLRRHTALHTGEKSFYCTESGCNTAFTKHYQLRAHILETHALPGTKAYQCYAENCSKTFDTTQHLRAHMKTHDATRYACTRSDCLAEDGTRLSFSNWTALQKHIKAAHPPTCNYPECKGKTFSSPHNLRVHQKLHEQRNIEAQLLDYASDEEPPSKRRRGGEIGRDWVCDVEGCEKDFKSKKALHTHKNVAHLGQRDFVCPYEDCGQAYGYKHLLQRHLASKHVESDDSSSTQEDGDVPNTSQAVAFDIDAITGVAYKTRTQDEVSQGHKLLCPHPDLSAFLPHEDKTAKSRVPPCSYAFSRSYDLRRHLQSVHDISADKEVVDHWVKSQKLHQHRQHENH